MESYSLRYQFSQRFNLPARRSYEWCTDFRPDDPARMGLQGTRKIERINDDTLILTDTIRGQREQKRRLVRLNPDRLAWTGTHLNGSNKFSQFWYQVTAEGTQGSHLEFAGLRVNYGRPPAPSRVAQMAQALAAGDSADWALLAKEMERDLSRPRK